MPSLNMGSVCLFVVSCEIAISRLCCTAFYTSSFILFCVKKNGQRLSGLFYKRDQALELTSHVRRCSID